MRTQRMYNPQQTFYALKSFKYAGKNYVRGNIFTDSRDTTNKQLLKLFQNGFVGYEGDFKYNKPERMKEVEIERPTTQSEEPSPKKQKKPKSKKVVTETEEGVEDE